MKIMHRYSFVPLLVITASVHHVLAQNYRLPITVLPTYYTIKLIPYFEDRNFTFDGEVEIIVNATTTDNSIVLHYNTMEILETPSVTTVDENVKLDVVNTSYDNVTDFFRLELNEDLQVGKEYVIRIKFIGHMDDDAVGFYRCSYKTSDNETRWLAVTQFEPTDARKAFPCFDEPALKARFQINIARPEDYHSISNMPRINSSEPDSSIGGRIWDAFQETPPMSTYLVAFVMSDLKNLSTKDGKYSVWMREEVVSQGKYALTIAPSIINHLENMTAIMYELPKLDQVVIPDLFFWAMENWGLVTLWEGQITFRDGVSSAARKQNTLLLVAHEFAHFWFGDLVSPKWWNYLWLNEGFATYYEYGISAQMEPQWNLDEQFNADIYSSALAEDALNSTHPITVEVGSPDEINAIFDTVSYDKASCIIRSMEHFLTKETFEKGISKYLKRHSHSNTEADDLFDILDKQQKEDEILPTDMDVKTIMDSWTLQPGYPVINVMRKNGTIDISQERFLMKQPEEAQDMLWWVPVSYTRSTDINFVDTKPKTWLRAQRDLKLIDKIEDDEWIVLNVQTSGFYRVNYDSLTWSLLANHLKYQDYTDIHVLNRAQLLDDSFSLAETGELNYTIPLDLSTYLAEEEHSVPWSIYLNKISHIKLHLRSSENYDDFKTYVLSLLNNLYDVVGFSSGLEDNHMMKMIQPTVLHWACSLGHKDCVSRSIELFSSWMSQPDKSIIPPDVKDVVYCTAARNNKKMWEFLWNQLQVEVNDDSRENIFGSLGCTDDTTLLDRYLSTLLTAKNESDVHEVETALYFIILHSPNGVRFLSEKLQDIHDSLDSKSFMEDLISMISSFITTKEEAEKVKNFLINNDLLEEAEEKNWIPETMEDDIMWNERYSHVISTWLKDFTQKNKN